MHDKGDKEFEFDRVFNPQEGQETVSEVHGMLWDVWVIRWPAGGAALQPQQPHTTSGCPHVHNGDGPCTYILVSFLHSCVLQAHNLIPTSHAVCVTWVMGAGV